MSARVYLLETKYELIKLLRLPAFLIPTLGFPLMFYVLFGLLMGGSSGGRASTYLLATYGEDAHLMAGGTALVLLLQQGLVQPGHVVGLRDVPELHGVRRLDDGGQGGACRCHIVPGQDAATLAAL